MPPMQFGGVCAPYVLMVDTTGWCRYASPSLARLLRTTLNALHGMGWMAYLDGRQMTRDEWRAAHDRAISFMVSHSLALRPGDPTRGFYTHFSRQFNPITGLLVGYVGFVQDVTVEMFKAARLRAALQVASDTAQTV